MAQPDVTIKGLQELYKMMNSLPIKMEFDIGKDAMRAGMVPVKLDAQAALSSHRVTGKLARGLRISASSSRGVVRGRLRSTGKHRHVAIWVEYGVKAHTIKMKTANALYFGEVFRRSVRHPGYVQIPFMRPALDSNKTDAVKAMAHRMSLRLHSKQAYEGAPMSKNEAPDPETPVRS